MSQMESKGIKWSSTILIMISRDWMRILYIDMSWEVDINMIGQKKMKRSENMNMFQNMKIMGRKPKSSKFRNISYYEI